MCRWLLFHGFFCNMISSLLIPSIHFHKSSVRCFVVKHYYNTIINKKRSLLLFDPKVNTFVTSVFSSYDTNTIIKNRNHQRENVQFYYTTTTTPSSSSRLYSNSNDNDNDNNNNNNSVSGIIYEDTTSSSPVIIKLYTKKGCTLCDYVKDVLISIQNNYPHTLIQVDITDVEHIVWWNKYKYDIPVLHINDMYWTKHKLNNDNDAIQAIQDVKSGTFHSPKSGEPNASVMEKKYNKNTCIK